MENARAIIEALIFAAESPLAVDRIRDILPELSPEMIRRLIEDLRREHDARQGGIILESVAGGFQYRTRPEMGGWLRKMRQGRAAALSAAAMETLAIVAYRQPVMKAEIDRIRGVDSGGTVKGLMEKRLVRILGRKDVPGKPILYGTTRRFLETFQLNDLSELPTLRELKDLQDGEKRDMTGMTGAPSDG